MSFHETGSSFMRGATTIITSLICRKTWGRFDGKGVTCEQVPVTAVFLFECINNWNCNVLSEADANGSSAEEFFERSAVCEMRVGSAKCRVGEN